MQFWSSIVCVAFAKSRVQVDYNNSWSHNMQTKDNPKTYKLQQTAAKHNTFGSKKFYWEGKNLKTNIQMQHFENKVANF